MRDRNGPGIRNFKSFGPMSPKPFDFVPFTKNLRQERPKVGHERFVLDTEVYSGAMHYRLLVLNHLFISSGQYAFSEDVGGSAGRVIRSCYRAAVGAQAIPAVPGSSIKGALRSIVEAVTASCISVSRVDRRLLPNPSAARLCRPEAICPACSLFGTMSRLARISLDDALLTNGETATMSYRLPPLYRPRAGQAPRTYFDSRRLYKGRKFYFHGKRADHTAGASVEVIPEKSVLDGKLQFENLRASELGLLFFAMGLDGSFCPMLGGGKPVCLGSVQFKPVALELLDDAYFLNYECACAQLEDEELMRFVADRIQDAFAEKLILQQQHKALAVILDPNNSRSAPTGMY